jgi:Flp pilus assembly protein TadG
MGMLRRREGAVAAEFALVAPLLFSLIMGGIEYGSLVYSMSSMQLAANVTARDIAVNNLSEAEAEARMAPYLPGWMAGDISISLSESHPDQPRINTRKIRLTADAADAVAISIFTRAASWTVSAEANVQQEMPFNNGDEDD